MKSNHKERALKVLKITLIITGILLIMAGCGYFITSCTRLNDEVSLEFYEGRLYQSKDSTDLIRFGDLITKDGKTNYDETRIIIGGTDNHVERDDIAYQENILLISVTLTNPETETPEAATLYFIAIDEGKILYNNNFDKYLYLWR